MDLKTSNFFSGLKMLCVCFDAELSTEWIRVVKVMSELMTRGEGGAPLWEFLEFMVSVRTSLYPLLRPIIFQKVTQ